MIAELQKKMLNMEQAEIPTRHLFCDGVYCREMFMKAGVCVVGAKHKTAFFLTISKGKCLIVDGNDKFILEAPMTVISKVGAKRAILALEDSVITGFHKTEKTDIEEIEKDIIEPEGLKIQNNPKEALCG